MVCFFIGLAGCVTLVVFWVCCSGLLLAGVHTDAEVWFWYFDVVTGVVGCCGFRFLIDTCFVGCGWVWCLMLVVVWLGGLFRFIAFGVDMVVRVCYFVVFC